MQEFDPIIRQAAETYGLDPVLLRAQMQQESGGKRGAISNKGASGLMQLMPGTAREMGVTDIFDPQQNIMAGAKYLKIQMDKYKSPELALAAYNAGPGAVDKYGGIPPYKETRNYVKRIIGNYAKLGGRIMDTVISPAHADETPWQSMKIDDADFAAWEQESQPQKPQQNLAIDDADFAEWEASQNKTTGQKVGEAITGLGNGVIDTVGGAVKGASNIGNTLLSAGDAYNEFVGNKNALTSLDTTGEERRAQVDEGLKSMGANPDSVLYKAGNIGGEIAGTSGMGGLIAPAVKALPYMNKLAPAIESWGMKGADLAENATRGAKALNVAQKAAGGAITSGAGGALIDPETAATSAVVGGAMPPAIQGAGKFGRAIGSRTVAMTRPLQAKIAEKIAKATGKPIDDVIDLLTNKARVDELPDLLRTVPQILQDPNISQLARTVKANSSMALSQAEQAQQNVFKQAIEGIAKPGMTVQDAADKAGGAISKSVQGGYKEATKAVSNKFNALRDNPEKLVTLPIDKMRGTVDQYLGKGAIGQGESMANRAIKVAEDLSEVKQAKLSNAGETIIGETIIKDTRTPWHKTPIDTEKDNMLTAITKLGGLNKGMAQSTYGNRIWEDVPTGFNTFRNDGGHSLDDMATLLSEEGYLPEGSGVYELTEKLYGNAKDTFSHAKLGYGHLDQPTSAADQLSQQLSDLITELQKKNAPKVAKKVADIIPRDLSGKVNFAELQRFRSSLGKLSNEAKLKGDTTGQAAFSQMVKDIDSHLDEMANNWDGVTPAWLDSYKDARKLHADKSTRFKSGVQEKMFKPKSNGRMTIEGGEIPGKFYSPKPSQTTDIEDFKRLVNNEPELIKELKEFALTKAKSTETATGNLADRYVKWAESHSGANRALFTAEEKAKIDAIANQIDLSAKADAMGMVKNSDTAQKLKGITDLGLVDNKVVDFIASKFPFGSAALATLKKSSGRERSDLIAELLADPDKLKAALGGINKAKKIAKPNKFASLLKHYPKVYPAAVQAQGRNDD